MSSTKLFQSAFAVIGLGVLLFLAFACSNSEKKVYKQDSTAFKQGSAIDSAYLSAPYFGPKHGMIEYESTSSGLKQKKTLFWIDFGRSIAIVGETKINGAIIQSRKIITPSFSFDIDFSNHQASKLPVIFDPAERVNYLALNQAVMDELKINKTGNDIILNNKCIIYKMDLPIIQSSAWIFDGMVLKSESVVRGMKSNMTAVKIDTTLIPDPMIFEVPQGFKIIDLTTP